MAPTEPNVSERYPSGPDAGAAGSLPDRARLASGMELAGAGVALSLAFIAVVVTRFSDTIVFNIAAPAMLGLALAYGVWRTFADHDLAVWLPALWFRLSAFCLYCAGALSPYLVDKTAHAYMQAWVQLDPPTVARCNLATTLGVAVVIGCLFCFRARNHSESARRHVLETPLGHLLTYGALAVGGAVRFGLSVPQSFGFEVPQRAVSLLPLAPLFHFGLLLLLLRVLQGRRSSLLAIVAALLLVDTALSLLSFLKVNVLTDFLLLFIASMTVRSSFMRFVSWSAALAVIFYLVTGLSDNARVMAAERYGDWGTPVERIAVLKEVLFGSTDRRYFDRNQSLLVRLCYTPLIAKAMEFGDDGRPNLTREYGFWPLVPRLLFPQKPNIDFGRQFYRMLSGQESSTNMSPTIIGDAYWNTGWPGVVLWMSAFGMVIAAWSWFSNFVVGSGRVLLWPIAFLGILFAIAHDGFIGTSMFTLAYTMYLGIGLAVLNLLTTRLWPGGTGAATAVAPDDR